MKTVEDTWGWQHSCINYDPCPLCFGCRAHDSSWYKCANCELNRKQNICNKQKHTVKVLNRMIRRKKLNV